MTVKNIKEDTVAAASLRPGATPGEVAQSLATAASGMAPEDLTKWYEQSIALIGHEADSIPPNASAANQATIVTKEEIEALLAGDTTLSEETKSKFTTLFEAAVVASVTEKVSVATAALDEKYDASLKEEVEKTKTQINEYLDYVVAEWLKENAVKIESELRVEIQEEFMDGLKNLFKEHYIEVPDEKLDILASVNEEVESLKTQLNAVTNENLDLKKVVKSSSKDSAIRKITEGMTAIDADKLKTLSEGIEFADVDSYSAALTVIKEKYVAKTPVGNTSILEESLEVAPTVVLDPRTKGYAAFISKTTPAATA
jgi:vacuolar-type H+-ATPase subunit E/Vma4